jgi:hypothetical protein
MIKKDLPKDGAERKVIVFMEFSERELAHLDETNQWLNDPNICVLEYPDENLAEDLLNDKIYKKLKEKGLLGNGHCVLVQNPYDLDDYSKADEIIEFFNSNASKKYRAFSEICQDLGATKLIYTSDDSEHNQTKLKISGNAENKVAKKLGSGEVNLDLDREIKKSTSVKGECEWSGSAPNIEAARNTLKHYHLDNDGDLLSLIRSREKENKKLSEKVTIRMIRDSMLSVNLAAKVKLPLLEGNFSSDLGRIKNTSEERSFIVEFGKG